VRARRGHGCRLAAPRAAGRPAVRRGAGRSIEAARWRDQVRRAAGVVPWWGDAPGTTAPPSWSAGARLGAARVSRGVRTHARGRLARASARAIAQARVRPAWRRRLLGPSEF